MRFQNISDKVADYNRHKLAVAKISLSLHIFNVRDMTNEIIIYQTEDGQTQIDVRMENETVWLTQAQMAELFGTKRPAITKHLKNIYASEELEESSTCSILEHMGNDGKQIYTTKYYNLDAILSVGYRVNSKFLQ